MSLPAPVVQTKAQLLRRVAGGQPEQLTLRDFIETVMPGLPEEFGNGFHDDEPYINEALATRSMVSLTPYARYRIGQSLLISGRSNVTLLGNGATLVCLASDFTNTGTDWHDRRAAAIHIFGGLVTPWTPASRITIRDLKIEFEVQDGRRVCGIVGANADDLMLDNVEISGWPVGTGIKLDSCLRYNILRPYLHDATDDTDGWTPGNNTQITAIAIDQDRVIVSGTPKDSIRGLIQGFRIESITVGPVFEAAFGYQADGINCGSTGSSARIEAGYIRDTGEGFDWFGVDTTILGVDVQGCEYFSCALKAGASRINVGDCNFEDVGITHLLMSAHVDRNSDGNHVHDCYMGAVAADGGSGACIRYDDNGLFTVQNCHVADNTLRPQTGNYAILVNGIGDNNSFLHNREFAGVTDAFEDVGGHVRVHIPATFILHGSKTFDAGSIADGAAEETTVTVEGAVFGQAAMAGMSITTAGLIVTAYVSAANTVTVRFQNETGAPVDLASATLHAWVMGA